MVGGMLVTDDEARRLLAGAVEVLVPGVERDGEQGAGLPFEGDALAGIVPHAGRAAPIEDQDHLLEELALRLELLARRDLAHVAVVGGARGLVVDEDAAAAAPCPRLQLDRAQVLHVMGADDVEPLVPHPARIGRVLLGRELLGKLVGNDGVLGHAALLFVRDQHPSPSGEGGLGCGSIRAGWGHGAKRRILTRCDPTPVLRTRPSPEGEGFPLAAMSAHRRAS